jgi:hypothetical protein
MPPVNFALVGDGGFTKYLPGWPWTEILPIAAFEVVPPGCFFFSFPFPFYSFCMLGFKPRALSMPGKHYIPNLNCLYFK